MRVPLMLVALLAMPLAVGAAQGQSGGNANANADNRCKNSPQAGKNAASQGGAAQAAQAQLHKNCPAPVPPVPVPPPPSSQPTGVNRALGMVYEEIDGNLGRDPFAGEMGLAGWTVQLIWNNQVVAEYTTDWDGAFHFDGLGNATYSLCVIVQAGYTQAPPTGCHSNTFSNSFETWWMPNDFGMLIPQ